MYQLQRQMQLNPALHLDMLPRFGKFHNDASYSDVIELVELPIFEGLRVFRDNKRLRILDSGPKNGSVEAPKLSRKAAQLMIDSDALYVKGSRAYELLATGIRKHSFFGQTVSREFSETIFGIDAHSTTPALTYVHMFPSFWGFRQRHTRFGNLSPTNRCDWMSSMTAIESALFTQSTGFQAAQAAIPKEELSSLLVNTAIEKQLPPHLTLPLLETTPSAK
jgi:hypothetical protein